MSRGLTAVTSGISSPCAAKYGPRKALCAACLPAPVLDKYAIGVRVMHGFASATAVYDVAQDDDGRPLIVLYVGDYDPSGVFMSERDLPERLEKYDGGHVEMRRIALTREQTEGLLSFPASDKKGDKRYRWFVRIFGSRCWELDPMDPPDLRACVKREIKELIEPVSWKRCEVVNKAEQESLRHCVRPMEAREALKDFTAVRCDGAGSI